MKKTLYALTLAGALLTGTVAWAADPAIGSRTRGDGIGTAGDAPLDEPHRPSRSDRSIGSDPGTGSRTRGDSIGTAGDAPLHPKGRFAPRANRAATHRQPIDPAIGARTRGDGAGSAGDEPR